MEVIFEMYRHIGSKVFSRAHFKYVRWITFDFDFAAGNLQGGCSEDISARRKSLLCKSLSIRFYYNLMCVCVNSRKLLFYKTMTSSVLDFKAAAAIFAGTSSSWCSN
jgi:hypothetical protein